MKSLLFTIPAVPHLADTVASVSHFQAQGRAV